MAAVTESTALRALFCLLLGCGTQGMSGELMVSSFPQSGLSGFTLLTSQDAPDLSAPYILLQPGLDIDEPTALVQDEAILLWFSLKPTGKQNGSIRARTGNTPLRVQCNR